ncbi:hypothetical protein [Mesorhizobium sp. CO1-1-9]|uniref:hypothetical protein n=1 Tax=Mesorhizobium sp. CO1-1-9 TaxID=2876630 RepID=UPI001CCCB0E0|nr:hypothetical protein [Mesorhizobium sp. CO1-1-9]MBZ9695502.1 hypothetical protein [Mesorhizobium sp. CO1-1-9]
MDNNIMLFLREFVVGRLATTPDEQANLDRVVNSLKREDPEAFALAERLGPLERCWRTGRPKLVVIDGGRAMAS